MDRYTYTVLDIIFFAPFILVWVVACRTLIVERWKFILSAGLLGIAIFFVMDLPATFSGAWTMNYAKTLGIRLGPSVFEELVWTILVSVSVGIIIEMYFKRKTAISDS